MRLYIKYFVYPYVLRERANKYIHSLIIITSLSTSSYSRTACDDVIAVSRCFSSWNGIFVASPLHPSPIWSSWWQVFPMLFHYCNCFPDFFLSTQNSSAIFWQSPFSCNHSSITKKQFMTSVSVCVCSFQHVQDSSCPYLFTLQNWLYCICRCGTGRCAVCVAEVSWHSPTNRIYHSFHVSKSFHSSFKINSVFLLEWHFLVLSPMETIHAHLLFFTLGCDTNSRGLWWDQWCAVCQHPP